MIFSYFGWMCLGGGRLRQRFFEFLRGDIFGGLRGGTALRGVPQDVHFLQVAPVGTAHEGPGAGDMLHESFRSQAMDRLANRGQANPDPVGQGPGDQAVSGA